jgi:threonine synthase
MTSVDETSKLDLDSSWLEALRKKFDSERVTDEEMCQLMRRILDKYGYFADPHTCVALAAAEKLGYPIDGDLQIPTAILATASPCKFEESVTIALGVENWKRYLSHHCPTKALEISDFEEVVPARYKAVPGMSLEDMQLEWQSQAGAILLELTKQ